MTARELRSLPFKPGLKRAAEVTSTCGRGVVLDAVLEAVRRLDGAVDLESERGRFTRVTMTVAVR